MLKIMKLIKMWWKGKRKWSDIWYYLQGKYREKLYYTTYGTGKWLTVRYHLLMHSHIKEQIDYRIEWMNKECYNSGSCIKCGCQTTALQMADKACDGLCYPPMMDKKEWKDYSNGERFYPEIWTNLARIFWIKDTITQKPLLFKYVNKEYRYVQQN